MGFEASPPNEFRASLRGGARKPVVVKARVIHSRISDVDQDVVTYYSGLEFVELPDRIRSVIAEFLEAIKTERSGV